MNVTVVEPDHVEPERSALSGSLFAHVGGVRIGSSVIEVAVAGDPTVIDLCVEERLNVDSEGLHDTLDNIRSRHRAIASIGLDAEGARGLIRLLSKATEVYAGITAAPDEVSR